jgi:ketopantoate reductase
MATIRKRGSSWQAQVRREGFPPIPKSFPTKAEAAAWAREKEAAIDRAKLPTTCAITGRTVGRAVVDPGTWLFLDDLVAEILQAAQLKGILLGGEEAHAFLRSVAAEAYDHEPSMLIDIRQGRTTEIECLNGAVIRERSRHGLPSPANRAFYAIIRAIEQRAVG